MEIADGVSGFLADRSRRDCNAQTLQTYRSQLTLFARWLADAGCCETTALCPRLVVAYVDDMRQRRGLNGRGELSRVTVRKRAKCLRTFLRWLADMGLCAPLAHCVPMPRVGRRLPKALTVEQITRLLSVPMCERDRAVLCLMYDAGPRLSEVCGLDIADLDLDRGSAFIRSGKGDRDRMIVFSAVTADALRAWLAVRPAYLNGTGTDAVFLSQYGRRCSGDALYRSVKTVAMRAGLGDVVRPHTLRHTFATHALDNGAPITDLQAQLGHENLETTMIYASVSMAGMARRHRDYSPLAVLARGVGQE